MKVLTLSEALTHLENGQWHSIAFYTADVNKQTAGQIIRIKECKLHAKENTHVNTTGYSHVATVPTHKKSANHREHATRNVRLRHGQMRKFHINLLFAINNTPVL